ncbi:hypothetical protein ACFS4T_06290 [Pseudomonas lini]
MRSRGSMNLWLANLAGFVGGLIGAMVVEILTRSAEGAGSPDAPFMLFSIMAGLGTFVGMWIWLIARLEQPENLFLRHLFAGGCQFLYRLGCAWYDVVVFGFRVSTFGGCWLVWRFREQARSHRGCALAAQRTTSTHLHLSNTPPI